MCDLARRQRDHRRPGALVADVHDIDARHGLEQFGCEMRRAAGGSSAIIERARPGPGDCDQFLDRACRNGRMDGEHIGRRDGQSERREIPDRIEGGVVLHEGQQPEIVRETKHRVAVGGGLRHDVDRGSAPVVHDHLPAQGAGERRRDHARRQIVQAARLGGDDADVPHRKGLGPRRAGRKRRQSGQHHRCREAFHGAREAVHAGRRAGVLAAGGVPANCAVRGAVGDLARRATSSRYCMRACVPGVSGR